MIDPVRKEVLETLAELSEHIPQVRLGQLMANLATIARGMKAEAIWDMEDEELLAVSKSHLEKWKNRTPALVEAA